MIKEKNPFSDTFRSQILSDACGVEVTIKVDGSITNLNFPKRPVGPQDLEMVKLAVVATAGDNQVRFQEVAIGQTRVEPDGTVIVSLAGHKLEFTGLEIRLDTGETIKEPHFSDPTPICKRLTG
jgi:hypothetical protein